MGVVQPSPHKVFSLQSWDAIMQDDRTLSFQDIQGSNDALLAAAKEIERTALVESDNVGPLRLRFLEPYPQDGTSHPHDYILTPARDFQTIDLDAHQYITVSYVWTHSQSIDGIPIPHYRIWDGANLQKPPRPLRCPPIVFHRIVKCAKIDQLTRIWIDQECIDQNDPDDVERHLQDMHRIFRFSRVTFAVFSKVSKYWKVLQSSLYHAEECSEIADRLLGWMVKDPWFTRSWTFHEQQCAGNLIYLLPTPLQLVEPTQADNSASSNWDIDNDVSVHQFTLRSYFELCAKMHRDNSALMSFFVGHGNARLVTTNIAGAIETVQEKMESRENRVFSDRIQIIANACRLGLKLRTRLLNTPNHSYSTCLLVLTMANTWPDGVERALQYEAWGDTLMGGDIKAALRELSSSQPSHLSPTYGLRPTPSNSTTPPSHSEKGLKGK